MKRITKGFMALVLISLIIIGLTGCLKTAVDKSALTSAISDANILKNSKTIGGENGNVSQAAFDKYTQSILSAQSVADNSNAKQAEVDKAVTDLQSETIIFRESVIVVVVPPSTTQLYYLYATDKSQSTMSGITIDGWEYSTKEEVDYMFYNPCLKSGRGEWAVHLQISGTTGIFDGYSALEFKVKADETNIKVIFDNKSGGTDGYDNYTETPNIKWGDLSTNETGITKEEAFDGWTKVTVDLSTLDSAKIKNATKLLFKMDSGEGYSGMHITDVILKKTSI